MGEHPFDALPSSSSTDFGLTAVAEALPITSSSPLLDEKPPMDPESARDVNLAAMADDGLKVRAVLPKHSPTRVPSRPLLPVILGFC